jgi:hypothetical protein
MVRVTSPLLLLALTVGCSAPASIFDSDADIVVHDASTDAPSFESKDSSSPGLNADGQAADSSAGGAPVIYANTDTDLYSMDPATQTVTLIGKFDDGTNTPPAMTDIAVNQGGDVWVCSETAIYTAAVPKSPGAVKLTKVADLALKTSQKFYALGFAPAGVLGSGETLVAGDNLGDLYAVETNGATTQLGNFGGDGAGGTYELSGDVTFFMVNGKPRGLATVLLYKKGSPAANNDILAEIDVAAMTTAYSSKTPAVSLKKQFLGTGTTFGHLYGVGAWNDSVYAFSRVETKPVSPAQLVKITAQGVGTSLKTFSSITQGWSGAGVTTSATVTVLPPN